MKSEKSETSKCSRVDYICRALFPLFRCLEIPGTCFVFYVCTWLLFHLANLTWQTFFTWQKNTPSAKKGCETETKSIFC